MITRAPSALQFGSTLRMRTAVILLAILGSGVLGLGPADATAAPPWAGRVPGAPVAPLDVVNHGWFGGDNLKTGDVPSTARIGVPDPGVVPLLGSPMTHADDGAYVASETRVAPRVVDLMIASPALGGASPVRLILPPGFESRTDWPVLYLLHGGGDQAEYQSWTLYGNATSSAAAKRAIIAMPTTGQDATVTNWWNDGQYGTNQYDTFVAEEIPQLLRRGYRAGSRAAVAGVSSGGYSSLAVAAHHPGAYGAAASFSGDADILLPSVSWGIQFGALLYLHSPFDIWGDRLDQVDIWRANNPADQCPSLAGTRLYVSAGDSVTGPLSPVDWIFDPAEAKTQLSSRSFAARCRAAGTQVTTHFYGPGTHSWGYWQREFRLAWPTLAAGLGVRP